MGIGSTRMPFHPFLHKGSNVLKSLEPISKNVFMFLLYWIFSGLYIINWILN
jgi:hypothetical protein